LIPKTSVIAPNIVINSKTLPITERVIQTTALVRLGPR
jgi:hypothetical protein